MLYPEKYNQYSDNELITEYINSKNTLFVGILYKRYSHLVFGLSLKYLKDEDEAKDAVMQLFEKLISDLLKYKIEYFKSWLYTYSKNNCLLIIRNKKNIQQKESQFQYSSQSVMENEADLHLPIIKDKEEQYVQLEKAISELNEMQKKCISLFYLQNKSYQDIADATGYTLNEVKSAIQNGKRNLKIKLDQS